MTLLKVWNLLKSKYDQYLQLTLQRSTREMSTLQQGEDESIPELPVNIQALTASLQMISYNAST